jgi:hypothetical protein
MSEQNKSFAEVVIDGETVPVTRDNLTLYRYLGVNAVYDHCYIDTPEDQPGGYIWAHYGHFEKFAKLAEEHRSRMYLNLTQPSDIETKSYLHDALNDLDQADAIAEGWITEGIE